MLIYTVFGLQDTFYGMGVGGRVSDIHLLYFGTFSKKRCYARGAIGLHIDLVRTVYGMYSVRVSMADLIGALN